MEFVVDTGNVVSSLEDIGVVIFYFYAAIFAMGFRKPAFWLSSAFRVKPKINTDGHYPNLFSLNSYRRVYLYCLAMLIAFFWLSGFYLLSNTPPEYLATGTVIIIIAIVGIGLLFLYYKMQELETGGKLKEGDHKKIQSLQHAFDTAAQTAGVSSMPASVIHYRIPTAFIFENEKTGKEHFFVSTGMLNTLNKEELLAVAAHEVALINEGSFKFRRSVTRLLKFLWAGAIFCLIAFLIPYMEADGDIVIGMAVILPLIVYLIGVLAEVFTYIIIAQETYHADVAAVQYTRYPEGLHSALRKTLYDSDDYSPMPSRVRPYLFTAEAGWFFRDPPYQPKTKDRIALLEEVYRLSPNQMLKNSTKDYPCPTCSVSMNEFVHVSRYGVGSTHWFCANCDRYWLLDNQLALLPADFRFHNSEVTSEVSSISEKDQRCPICGVILGRVDFGYNFIRPWTCPSCEGNSLGGKEIKEFIEKRATLQPMPYGEIKDIWPKVN